MRRYTPLLLIVATREMRLGEEVLMEWGQVIGREGKKWGLLTCFCYVPWSLRKLQRYPQPFAAALIAKAL